MPYKVFNTSVNGVLVLEPKIFGDARGFFFESFNARDFQQATGLQKNFVQDNHSKSDKGVLRGLHYQLEQPQGKLVRAIEGAVFDVVVDIRKNSTTFGRWFGIELSSMNKKQLWIPEGLAHGFMVITDTAEFLYKTTDYYHPQSEQSLLWNDPDLSINWPLHLLDAPPRLADKDLKAKAFADLNND